MKNIQYKRNLPVLPQHLAAQKVTVNPILANPFFDSFKIGKQQFAQFCDATLFAQIRSSLIEIDIQTECEAMTEESLLEVTVPILGLYDLMDEIEFLNQSLLMPSIVAVNGFGARQSNHESFPRVSFIKVLDIADNRYEITRTPEGMLELPEQGMGLFSVIKEITYVLDYQQVMGGDGLENLESVGVGKNKLYLLPPIHTDESFKLHVCLTHINEKNRRLVDVIHPIEVEFRETAIEWQPKEISVYSENNSEHNKKDLTLSLKLEGLFNSSRPMLINASFEACASTTFVAGDLNGWAQHPLFPHMFSKRYGLSQQTLMQLIQEVYTEFDFLRDYLIKNPIPLNRDHDYNNFLLRPEVFSKIYKSLIHDLARGYIPRDILLSRLQLERLFELDLSQIPVDFHDSIVLAQIQNEFDHGSIFTFSELLCPTVPCLSKTIEDRFYIYVNTTEYFKPKAIIEIMHEGVAPTPELGESSPEPNSKKKPKRY